MWRRYGRPWRRASPRGMGKEEGNGELGTGKGTGHRSVYEAVCVRGGGVRGGYWGAGAGRQVREVQSRQRDDGDPARGPQPARGDDQHVLLRGGEGGVGAPERVCAPLRA